MGLALGCSVMIATPSYAVPYGWTDWTTANTTSAAGTVNGVGVSFSGNLAPAAQTSGGTNFWATNPSIYTSAGVDNGPTPNSDIIRLTGGTGTGTQTLTFSTPVTDPVMAILSLGQSIASNGVDVPVDYIFSAPFTILNQGIGFWGGSPTALTGNLTSTLRGLEGHGIIQFSGSFNSISWTMPLGENWHGFTVGTAVPEPASLMLLGAGLAAIGIWRRKAAKG
jgi:PEP-CTERM motif